MDDKKPVQIFLESTTVKGLPKIVKSRHLYQKGLWSFGFVFGVIVGLLLIFNLVTSYFKYETSITSFSEDKTPLMPDLTVCKLQVGAEPEEFNLKFDDYLRSVGMQMAKPMSVEAATLNQNQTKGNVKEIELLFLLYEQIGYYQNVDVNIRDELVAQLVKIFYINLWDFGWSTPVVEKLRSEDTWFNTNDKKFMKYVSQFEGAMKTLYSARYGPCFKFSVSATELGNLTEAVGTILYLDDSRIHTALHPSIPYDVYNSESGGLRVVLHEPGTIPDMSRGINVAPGFETTLTVHATHRTRLGTPYGTCSDAKTIKHNYKYSTYACKSICRQNAVKKTCGCLDGKYMTINEDLKDVEFCGKIFPDNVSLTLDRMKCAMTLEVEDCHCPEKCDEYQYDFRLNQVPWPHQDHIMPFYYGFIQNDTKISQRFHIYEEVHENLTKSTNSGDHLEYQKSLVLLRSLSLIQQNFVNLKILFDKPETVVIKDTPKMTLESIFANMGATLNLWIGVTFLTFIELIELIFNCCSNRALLRQTTTKVQAIEATNK